MEDELFDFVGRLNESLKKKLDLRFSKRPDIEETEHRVNSLNELVILMETTISGITRELTWLEENQIRHNILREEGDEFLKLIQERCRLSIEYLQEISEDLK